MNPRAWRWIALAAGVWFALQVIAGLVVPFGGACADIGLFVRPMDGESRVRSVLSEIAKISGKEPVDKWRRRLKRLDGAVRRNPLDYRAQLARFQVLQRMETLGEDTGEAAAEAMRRTLVLRWKNPEVGVAGMEYALSRWPLLNGEERGFFQGLLPKITMNLRTRDFEQILKVWGMYSRDMDLLRVALDQRPVFNLSAAGELARLQIHPNARLKFLARYEDWAVQHFKEKLQQRISAGADNFDAWKFIANQLSKAVDGYSRLVPDYNDAYDEFRKAMDGLELKMVSALTGSMEWNRRMATRREIIRLVEGMLRRPASPSILQELHKRLERTRFFAQSNLEILELRMRLLFMMEKFPTVASLGSAELARRHYVPPEEADAVRRVFLIYVRALRRMEKPGDATRVLAVVRERTGDSPQLAWTEFVLDHPDAIDSGSAAWMNLPGEVRDSYRIPIGRNRTVRTMVYPPRSGELVIEVQADADSILDASHLVMVHVDGRLTAERYVRELLPGAVWKIKLPENPERLPVSVEIRIK